MFLRPRRDFALLSLIFVCVVIDRYLPFEYGTLDYYMQYLDPAVLRDDLARGLLYLHSQPPLFNLFLGLFLKTVPSGAQRTAMALLYAGLGLFVVLGAYALMRRLGVPQAGAFWFSCGLQFFPSMILAERWLFYSYPLAAAILLSALALERSLATGTLTWLAAFLTIVACIVLARGFFHVVFWMLPILVGALLWTGRRDPGRFGIRAALCLGFMLLAVSIYARNQILFGTFTSSTLQGMNLAGMTRFVEEDAIRRHVAEGRVTPLALIPRFSEPRVYFDYYRWRPRTGVEILDAPTKSTGAINWNNAVYARAAKEYEGNTLRIIAAEPVAYLKAVVNEVYIFFGFTPYRYFDSPLVRIRQDTRTHEIWDLVSRRFVPLAFAFGFAIVVCHTSRTAVRGLRREAARESRSAICVYIVWNLLYTLALANLAELGEGCFMRIPVDPLLCVGLALAVAPAARPFGCLPRTSRAPVHEGPA